MSSFELCPSRSASATVWAVLLIVTALPVTQPHCYLESQCCLRQPACHSLSQRSVALQVRTTRRRRHGDDVDRPTGRDLASVTGLRVSYLADGCSACSTARREKPTRVQSDALGDLRAAHSVSTHSSNMESPRSPTFMRGQKMRVFIM